MYSVLLGLDRATGRLLGNGDDLEIWFAYELKNG